MNRSELIAQIAESAEVSKNDASKVLSAVLNTIKNSLSKGKAVTIVGFGTFKVVERAAREGRNPQTGKPIKIAAQKAPRFSAGKQLKEACNQDK